MTQKIGLKTLKSPAGYAVNLHDFCGFVTLVFQCHPVVGIEDHCELDEREHFPDDLADFVGCLANAEFEDVRSHSQRSFLEPRE